MMLTDSQINAFVSRVLHLGPGERKAYLEQVDTRGYLHTATLGGACIMRQVQVFQLQHRERRTYA